MKIFSSLKQLFSRHRFCDDLSAEIQQHLEEKIEELVSTGLSRKDARHAARREFGNLTLVEQDSRAVWRWAPLESFLADVRYAIRTLRKSPGFTFVVIATLALGIGANTAIFSVLESQLWRPLSFPDSEQLVDAHVIQRENPRRWDVLPATVYRTWHEQSRSFKSLGAYDYPTLRNLTAGGTSERVEVMPVTSSLFDTLEVPLDRGRAFLPDEQAPGRDHVAILSHALWQSRFSSDASIIGRSIAIDGQLYVIVGIASPRLRFEYVAEPAVYVPLAIDPASKILKNTYVIGRLVPGVSYERARSELDGILQRELQTEGSRQEVAAAATNLRETWTNFAARSLYFFAGAVLLVLLIACVNNAGLVLARGLARRREFALRAALGASRVTLIRQALVESLLLSLAGGIAGALLGLWGADAFVAFIPADTLPRSTPISLDARVLLFVLTVSIFSALLTGIAPALFSSRSDVNEVLRQGASGFSAARSQHKARHVLIAVEVSLALILLFGASLFLSSFLRLQEAPRGFDAPGALTFRVALRGQNYAQPEQWKRYFQSLTDQLSSLAGVQAVTLGTGIPTDGHILGASVNVAGRPPHGKYGYGLVAYAVAPNFFGVLHMRLLSGRAFSHQDSASSPHVAIVNRNAAHRLFGSEDPLGRVLEFAPDERRGETAEPPVQIVGVSENAQVYGANEVPFDVIYFPFSQRPAAAADFVVSSSLPRGTLSGAIRDAAYSLDKDQPIFDVQTTDELIGSSLGGARFDLLLVAALAIAALALVSVGIFGAVSYFVQQRTQEFGIRLALGATPARILRHALSRSFATGLVGLLFGIAASLALGTVLRSVLYRVPDERAGMLYHVKIGDPLSMLLACLVLLLILFLASFLPARRAMRVDPMVALRYE